MIISMRQTKVIQGPWQKVTLRIARILKASQATKGCRGPSLTTFRARLRTFLASIHHLRTKIWWAREDFWSMNQRSISSPRNLHFSLGNRVSQKSFWALLRSLLKTIWHQSWVNLINTRIFRPWFLLLTFLPRSPFLVKSHLAARSLEEECSTSPWSKLLKMTAICPELSFSQTLLIDSTSRCKTKLTNKTRWILETT